MSNVTELMMKVLDNVTCYYSISDLTKENLFILDYSHFPQVQTTVLGSGLQSVQASRRNANTPRHTYSPWVGVLPPVKVAIAAVPILPLHGKLSGTSNIQL